MNPIVASQNEAFAALSDPARRELYRLATGREIGRDDAAELLGIPRSTAAFHLDRLTDAGLLTVEFHRRSGRTGPGAGRPAKVYRAVASELSASIPERHYELVAELLASAVERAASERRPVTDMLQEEAFASGAAIGAGQANTNDALTVCGYEPHTDESGDLVLDNCPFHLLSSRHRDLVCGANLALVQGVAAATGDTRTPVLAPRAGHCCVALQQLTKA